MTYGQRLLNKGVEEAEYNLYFFYIKEENQREISNILSLSITIIIEGCWLNSVQRSIKIREKAQLLRIKEILRH